MLQFASGKMSVKYKENLISLAAHYSAVTFQSRREWHDVFKVLKGNNLQPKVLYPARLSFRIEGEIKNF